MKKTVWVLIDNRMGSVGQARGVAQELDGEVFESQEKKIVYNQFAGLPNWVKGVSLIGVEKESKKTLVPPYPDVVISASRRTATVARYIKKKSGGKTKIVQLLHPGNSGLEDFDLIFLPEHDADRRKVTKNTIFTVGCPHRINEKSLKEAKAKWEEKFANLPKPLTTVIVGGSIKGKPFSLDNARKLIDDVITFKNQIGGSVLITTSNRTGKEAQELIMNRLRESGLPKYTYLWGDKSENPYIGFLAMADNVIVTGESVSMCSEACGTGKPVFIFAGEKWLTPKHYRFIKSLYDGKYATALDEKNAAFKPKGGRLNAAKDVAEKILEIV